MTRSDFFPALNDRTRQLATVSLVWLGIAAGSTFLFLLNPASPANQSIFPKCLFRSLTGWQCPGCGATRGLYQLLHLHPVAAFKLNPLMVLTLPIILHGVFVFTKSGITGRPYRQIVIPPVVWWTWLAIVIGFWVFRNTPWYPFVS
jgi:hypothetical protein